MPQKYMPKVIQTIVTSFPGSAMPHFRPGIAFSMPEIALRAKQSTAGCLLPHVELTHLSPYPTVNAVTIANLGALSLTSAPDIAQRLDREKATIVSRRCRGRSGCRRVRLLRVRWPTQHVRKRVQSR
eukprot:1367314-Rhodomonas_salina.6